MKTHRPYPVTRQLASACSLIALLFASPTLHAATYTWNSTSTGGAWDTLTSNWTGAGSTWVNGNDATFGFTTSGQTISLSSAITTTGITTNGSATVSIGSGSLIAPTITLGTGSGIDLLSTLGNTTGLSLVGGGSSTTTGRLGIKTAQTYTGNTTLSNGAYLMLDGTANNLLPTGTIVTLNSGTVMRFGKSTSASHQIAGLSGAGQAISQSSAGAIHTLTISTSSGNANQTFSGTLSNSTSTLALVIAGNGTQTLSGTNSFSGTTTISGGTLILGSGLTNSSLVTVNGGTLETSANLTFGAADVSMSSGAINVRGTGTAGTLTLASGKNFISTGGTLNFDLVNSLSFDKIIGSGSGKFDLTNTTLALSGLTSVAGTYQLFTGFGGTNSVTALTITGLAGGFTGSLDTTGLLTVSAVPEPSTYAALAGVATLGFATLRRRRTAQR